MTWTLVASADAPSAGAFDLPSLTLTGLKVLEVLISGVTVTTDDTIVTLTFYVSGSEVTTGYRWGCFNLSSTGSLLVQGDTADPAITISSPSATWGVGNAASEHLNASIIIDQPISTALYKRADVRSALVVPSGNVVVTNGVGIMENAGAIDGVKISGTSNLTAGKVRLLGLA